MLACATLFAQRPSRGEALLAQGKTQWEEYCVRMSSHKIDDIMNVLTDAVQTLKAEKKDDKMCEALLILCEAYAKDYRYHEAVMLLLEKVREFSPDPASRHHIRATLLLSNLYYHYGPEKSTRLFTSIDRRHLEALSDQEVFFAYFGRAILQAFSINESKIAAYFFSDLSQLNLEEMDDYTRVLFIRTAVAYIDQLLDSLEPEGAEVFIEACRTLIKDYHLEESAAAYPLKYVMAKFLLKSGNPEQACKLAEDIILPVANHIGPLSMEAVEISLLYAEATTKTGNPDFAIQLLNSYLDTFQRFLGTDSYPYFRFGTNIAKIHYQKQDYAAAARVFEGCAPYAFSHRYDLFVTYPFLAMVQSKAGNTGKALEAGKSAVAFLRESLHKGFMLLPETSRQSNWSSSFYLLVNGTANAIAPASASDKDGILYDLALLSKGVLCESGTQFIEMIRKNADLNLERAWNDCVKLNMELEDLRCLPKLDIQAIRKAEEKLAGAESVFMAESESAQLEEFYWGDCSWRKISGALSHGEAAIEYLRYKDADTGVYRYVASVLRSGAAPVSVPLGDIDEKSLMEMPRQKICDEETLYGLFLRPVERLISTAETVYFSPVGVINALPLESVITRIPLRRLSSTRQLLQQDDKTRWSSAVLFGGLDYNLDREEMEYYADASSGRAGSARNAQWSFLRGSKDEVTDIFNLLTASDKQLITDGEGVEERFKALSGKGVNLIHIATHGFFDNEDAASRGLVEEDLAMYKSGLVFAGANNHISSDSGMDDGLLSALEISRLNLVGCDLVVLSACGTGRVATDRTNDVYGLVRAFKKAGCRSILMTLWEVDDRATALLMDSFYKELASGQDKTSALSAARQKTRQSYPDPKDWAPFILID